MLIKKGSLVKHSLFGYVGIVTKPPFAFNDHDAQYCQVWWQLASGDVGLTKVNQKRTEYVPHLEVLNGEKKEL